LGFNILNTIDDQRLKDVHVQVTVGEGTLFVISSKLQ
jgi:hypothetical protein